MSDNYIEEVTPLLRLLRTEAFRFVLVYFNHYSLANKLKADLIEHFPNRSFAKTDAATTSYRNIADVYYHLNNGIFFIDNFEEVLEDPEKYNGLNLHRDKLAQYPIAMICFISPGSQKLSARKILENMPDLWSFRSLILDLKREIQTGNEFVDLAIERETNKNELSISSLGGYENKSKLAELQRLHTLVSKTEATEKALIKTLYRQILVLQKDLGFYNDALITIEILKKSADKNEEMSHLYFDEGEILAIVGQYDAAIKSYNKSLQFLSEQSEIDNSRRGAISQRLGSIYLDKGEVTKSLEYFQSYNLIDKELYEKSPQNLEFKNGLALSFCYLGNVMRLLGRLSEALSYYEQYNSLSTELNISSPDDIEYKLNLAISYSKLGLSYEVFGDFNKALSYFERYNQLVEELYIVNPQRVQIKNSLAASYQFLGNMQETIGNPHKALFYYERFKKISEELYNIYPDNISLKHSLAISYQYIGKAYMLLDNFANALSYFRHYNEIEKELNSSYPNSVSFKDNLATSYQYLGNAELFLGNYDNALLYFQNDSLISNELYTHYPNNQDYKNSLAISFQNLGRVYSSLGEYSEALQYHKMQSELMKELYSSYPENIKYKRGLARSYMQLGELYMNELSDNLNAKNYISQAEILLKELSEVFSSSIQYQNEVFWIEGALQHL